MGGQAQWGKGKKAGECKGAMGEEEGIKGAGKVLWVGMGTRKAWDTQAGTGCWGPTMPTKVVAQAKGNMCVHVQWEAKCKIIR